MNVPRSLLSVLLLWASPSLCSIAVAQQVGDPNFNTKVAKPAYTDKHPNVLFDEAHFNVHTTTGQYRVFAELMTNDGYKVNPLTNKKFEAKVLEGMDVLVTANPRGALTRSEKPAFTDDECQAVKKWVEAGGSLLLIVDHYPIGYAAEPMGKVFGVEMGLGTTTDAANAAPGAGNASALLFSRDNKLLADHAITRGRDEREKVNRVVTFTGESLKGPPDSVQILKLGDSAVDVMMNQNGKRVSAAGRCQGLAMKFGKGRVVMLGEASELSAQLAGPNKRPMGMNFKECDNRQFALNIMHWMSGLIE